MSHTIILNREVIILKNFLILGGDLRQLKVSDYLKKHNYNVKTIGFDSYMSEEEFSFKNFTENADAIVLPLPCTTDGETINMPMSSWKMSFEQLFKAMNSNQILIAGKINEKIKLIAEKYNIKIYDYFSREELIILNCIPTVEGAIQIAMEETARTIHKSKCMVLGYGRIGKLLSKTLASLGADVTVSARRPEDIAWITANGYTPVKTSEISSIINKQNIIFNTIPTIVLKNDVLKQISDDTLIIDLASKPGGIDFETASQMKKRVIWALSLPGKVAPITAGEIIGSTVLNIIKELEV